MTWSGFHRLTPDERLAKVQQHAGLSDEEASTLAAPSALPAKHGQAFVENAVGAMPVPLGFAVGFVVDGQDVVVPMAVEESSVVAAASHGAKLAASNGGFATSADEPITIGQIEVRSPRQGIDVVATMSDAWIAKANASIPSMVARGGGVKGIEARQVGDRIVVHLHVNCCDAMGANVVNSVCELLGPDVASALDGTLGLCILSNLADQRLARAQARIPVAAVGGFAQAQAMVAANQFAMEDPYRAATHNKGILNGVDPVVVATGNDWRAVEAGAHAYAARDGQYRALTRYAIEDGHLMASLSMPMSVGTVGGVTSLHPTAAACLRVLGSPTATQLARIIVAVGLAQNLAALRALSQEGIQAGHMRLHEANRALHDP